MLKDFLKNTVLRPGLERLGTVAAVWLIAQGDWLCAVHNACGLMNPEAAETLVAGVIIGGMFAFDLVVIQWNRIKGNR